MKRNSNSRFIPENMSRPGAIFSLAVIAGLTIATPIMLVGDYFNVSVIEFIGVTVFILCWVVAFVAITKVLIDFWNGKF